MHVGVRACDEKVTTRRHSLKTEMPSTRSKRKINIMIRSQNPEGRGHRETDVGLEHELDFGEVSRRQYIRHGK